MPEEMRFSKVRETIEAVVVIQTQIAGLIEALSRLTTRIEALEARVTPAASDGR